MNLLHVAILGLIAAPQVAASQSALSKSPRSPAFSPDRLKR